MLFVAPIYGTKSPPLYPGGTGGGTGEGGGVTCAQEKAVNGL